MLRKRIITLEETTIPEFEASLQDARSIYSAATMTEQELKLL